MPSKLNEALMQVVDAVIEKTNKYHAKTVCTPEKNCGYCQIQHHILAVSEDLWEKEGEELELALDSFLLSALPDVPSSIRKLALQKCKERIEEFIELSEEDDEETPPVIIQ
jgi:hypothetical protein